MNESEFWAGVCRGLGWEPTPWRIAVFTEWHRFEGMPLGETWNPIATTRLSPNTPLNSDYNIGYGPGNWNGVPVRVYRDATAGITATVETLALDYYPNIRRCFMDQAPNPEALPEYTTYIGSVVAYGQSLLDFMARCSASKGEPPAPAPAVTSTAPKPTTTEEIVGMLIRVAGGGWGFIADDGRQLRGVEALTYLDERQRSMPQGLLLTQIAVAGADARQDAAIAELRGLIAPKGDKS